MKVIERALLQGEAGNRGTEVAVYQDGIGLRQHYSMDGHQNMFFTYDEIEKLAKLARKHKRRVAQLEAQDNAAIMP